MAKRPSKPVSSRRKPAQPKPKDQATSRHVAKVTLQSVADRRQSMQERVARDRAQRYSAYLQQIEHPAERAGVGVRSLAATAARRRLRILAEGDSWFEYPLPLIGGDGVIVQLERLLGYPILNMAHHGDEVRQMLALQQRREIIARLSDPNIRFDAMLFSGGGNDLVGNQFCLWLKDVQTGVPPEQLLNDERVKAIIGTVEAGYEDLIEIRNRHSPNTALFLHGYDFPKATGIGVCGVGP